MFNLIPEQKIAINRNKSIRSIAIFSQMKKSIQTDQYRSVRTDLRNFQRSDTETEFPGIWTYLRRDVNVFSIGVLRVEFLLKTESGYLRDAEVT